MSTTDNHEQLDDVLSHFNNGMLITLDADGSPCARPMHIAQRSGGEMWFVTSADSDKVDEITQSARAAVALQGSSRYAHLRGAAVIVNDQAKIEELWSKPMELWFPDGPRSQDIALIKFLADDGEYWDVSGAQALSFAVDAARAALNNEEVPRREARHGSVSF